MNRPGILREPWRSKGFTLTELLISIGLIAVLAALLIPAMTSLRSRSQQSRCTGHLRALATALRLSSTEGTSLSPHKRPNTIYSFLGGSVPGEDTWSALLFRAGYIENKKIFRCPAVVASTAFEAANWYYEVYGLNLITQPGITIGENVSSGGYSGGVYTLPISRVSEPSRLILLTDSRAAALSAAGQEVQRFRLLQGTASAKADGISLRHGGRANVAFLDGHIEPLTRKDLLALRQSPYASIPFYDETGTYYP